MTTVWEKSPLIFSDIFFANGWKFLLQILHAYYTFLIPIYAKLQIFIQLPATLTKLRHIKRDHYMLKISTIGQWWVIVIFVTN